jgi:hypothetical protein
MTSYGRYLTVDIVGHLGWGYPLNTQKEKTNRHLITAGSLAAFRVALCMHYPPLYHIKPDKLVSLSKNSLRLRVLSLLEIMIKARLELPKNAQNDLLSFISDGEDDTEVRDSSLWAEATFFFPAGT